MSLLQTLSLFLITILNSNWVCSTTEFVFNANFNSSNLLLFGDATIQQRHSSSSSSNDNNNNKILSLTNDSTTFSMGRALFPSKIPSLNSTNTSFSTSFIFSISSVNGFQPGHGFAFLFTPSAGLAGASSSQHLGLFNCTNNGDPDNHVFAVEFDVFKNQEFQDIDDNHVGLNVNSLTSLASEPAGYWVGEEEEEEDDDMEFKKIELKNGVNYQVWIDFFDSRINVSMAPAGKRRPRRALISESLDLSDVFLDEMYVGFTGASGQLVESHRILAWSFSNTNFSIGDALVTRDLPSFVAASEGSRGLVVGVSVGCVVVVCGLLVIGFLLLVRKRRKTNKDEEIGEWERDYWPHRIGYKEIHKATMGACCGS
ncbi:putative L-type lectin-domain containing receptor kinase VII.2 [Morus notabilis]|uniref:Putative L-type lectin-domain containing receptor kinase VII.2 n=1 Tax=Morus notabilis TaxID=981085 RepID=W9SEI2_9ROSA|nr:putative L-type lectin-domain containing receptor kinase VII.2 [Morus notabilis]